MTCDDHNVSISFLLKLEEPTKRQTIIEIAFWIFNLKPKPRHGVAATHVAMAAMKIAALLSMPPHCIVVAVLLAGPADVGMCVAVGTGGDAMCKAGAEGGCEQYMLQYYVRVAPMENAPGGILYNNTNRMVRYC